MRFAVSVAFAVLLASQHYPLGIVCLRLLSFEVWVPIDSKKLIRDLDGHAQ